MSQTEVGGGGGAFGPNSKKAPDNKGEAGGNSGPKSGGGFGAGGGNFGPGSGGGLGPNKSKTGGFGAWDPASVGPQEIPNPVTLDLPGEVNQTIVGGAGKYLLAFVPSEQKVLLIDVAEGKLLKEASLGSPTAVIAANSEKLFVLLPDESLIQRWNLEKLERETSVPFARDLELRTLTVGHASNNTPLLVGSAKNSRQKPHFIDPKTLQARPFVRPGTARDFDCDETCVVRASASGNLFVSTHTKSFPTGIFSLIYNNGRAENFHEHEEAYRVLPSAAGDRIYTGNGFWGPRMQKLTAPKTKTSFSKNTILLPSVTGDYWIKFFYSGSDPVKNTANATMEFYLWGDQEPLVTHVLRDAPRQKEEHTTVGTIDQQVLLFPGAKRLVVLNREQDKVRFFPLDLDELLKKANRSFLNVESQAPVAAIPGKMYEYQLQVKSNSPAVKYSLLAAPAAMRISPTGKLTWLVPANLSGFADVIVSINNGPDQELLHKFRVSVGDNPVRPIPLVTATAKPDAVGDSSPMKLEPAKFTGASTQIKLPGTIQGFTLAAGGRFAVGHAKDLQKLVVADLVEGKLVGFIPVEDDEPLFAGSNKHIVVVENKRQTIGRYALPDLRREINLPLSLPMRSIALGISSDGPLLMLPKTDHRSAAPRESILYDLMTLQPLPMQLPPTTSLLEPPFEPRASADGSTFVMPTSSQAMLIHAEGKQIKGPASDSPRYNGERMVWGLPNANGSVFYANARRYSAQLRPLDSKQQPYHEKLLLIPATEGRLYLSFLNETQSTYRGELEKAPSVYVEGNSRPLFKFESGVDLLPITEDDYRRNVRAHYDRRVAMIPAAKLIVSQNAAQDALVLTRFDLDAELQAADVDYLYVDSSPPKFVTPLETLTYNVTAKSKRGGVKFRLESGPTGMAIDEQGKLTWDVPAAPPPLPPGAAMKADVRADDPRAQLKIAEHDVVLSVSDDSGQAIFHTFTLLIREPEPTRKPDVVMDQGTKASTAAESVREQMLEQQRLSDQAKAVAAAEAQRKAMLAAQNRAKPSVPARAPAPPGTGTGLADLPESFFADRLGQTRTWTDVDTDRKLEAKFLGVANGKVKVAVDTREFEIPLTRLSRPDLIWLLEGVKPKAEAPAKNVAIPAERKPDTEPASGVKSLSP